MGPFKCYVTQWGWPGVGGVCVKKGSLIYSAVSSPLDCSKRFTLFALPGRPVHSNTNSASPGSILAMAAAITRND